MMLASALTGGSGKGCRVSDGKHSPAGFGSGSGGGWLGGFTCLHFKGINRTALNCKYANLFNICVNRSVLVCIRRGKQKF